jgi:TetR/AcrR family tetracycline transcriptional repressor
MRSLCEPEQRSNWNNVRKVILARSKRTVPPLGYGGLDRDHLTKHLLALAQRVGVDQVTMRDLAAEAGTSASSVYYHVSGKTEMLDLLIEAVVNTIELPSKGEWDQRIVALYVNGWRAFVAVPGIAGLLQRRPVAASAAILDRASRHILRESGLPANDVAAAHALLFTHLLGSVELQHSRTKTRGEVDLGGDPESVFVYGLRVILTGIRHMEGARL